jgi:hypothetical protein
VIPPVGTTSDVVHVGYSFGFFDHLPRVLNRSAHSLVRLD